MVCTRYYTFWNFLAIFILSFGIYYAYMWIANWLTFDKTYASIIEMHKSPLFYLTIGLCCILCFSVDLFLNSFKFNFFPSPSDFLRDLIKNKLKLEDHIHEFEHIFARIKTYYIKQDIKREVQLDKRREEIAKMVEKAKGNNASKVKPE